MPALQLRRRPLSAVLHRLQTNRARNRHRKRHPGVANPIVLPKTHPRIQNPRKKPKKKKNSKLEQPQFQIRPKPPSNINCRRRRAETPDISRPDEQFLKRIEEKKGLEMENSV